MTEEELEAIVLEAVRPAIAEWRLIAETAQAEVTQLRKRVAELEALNDAGSRAMDALEWFGEQARQQITDLIAWWAELRSQALSARQSQNIGTAPEGDQLGPALGPRSAETSGESPK